MKDFNLQDALKFLNTEINIPEDVLPKEVVPLEEAKIVDAINQGLPLMYDESDEQLYYIDTNGERFVCPDLSEGLSVSANWLNKYLPSVTFDIDQGGNTRKSLEVEGIYKMICLCHCISDFRKDFESILKSYDFENLTPKSGSNVLSITQYVQSLQDLNSTRISSIFAAAAIKLANYKEKNETYYIGQLTPEEISALEALRRNVKAIISKYEKDEGLNPSQMKNMSKLSKLQKIDKRDLEIENFVNNSSVSLIYKISKLSSERIPVLIKAKVFKKAEEYAENFVTSENLVSIERNDVKKKIKEKIITESYRAIVKTIRHDEIKKLKENPLSYKLKVKA